MLPSGGFHLSKAKKRKSRESKKRRTEKFIKQFKIIKQSSAGLVSFKTTSVTTEHARSVWPLWKIIP